MTLLGEVVITLKCGLAVGGLTVDCVGGIVKLNTDGAGDTTDGSNDGTSVVMSKEVVGASVTGNVGTGGVDDIVRLGTELGILVGDADVDIAEGTNECAIEGGEDTVWLGTELGILVGDADVGVSEGTDE